MNKAFLCWVAVISVSGCPLYAQGGYSSPIRIATPLAATCIDSKTDEVTVDLKRILLHKSNYLFTQDSKAGVAVLASLNATGNTKGAAPSVSTVPIKDEPEGQVSLAIEYPVADQLVLNQNGVTTRNIQLDVYIEKAKGSNAFGDVLNIAGQLLQKLPIPDNPYTAMANQFLTFTNGAINTEITNSDNATLIASISLLFNDRAQSDPVACAAQNYETTGAIAVLKADSGADGATLLPVDNLDQTYCFRYVITPAAELQYVTQPSAGCNALGPNPAWAEVPNDYLMLIVSAAPAAVSPPPRVFVSPSERQKRLAQSRMLCKALGSEPKYCGAR